MLDGICLSSHIVHFRCSNKDRFTNGEHSLILFANEITVMIERVKIRKIQTINIYVVCTSNLLQKK